MTPGPLPDPNRRRRNAPTIPTTNLPASGRIEPVPEPPEWVCLGEAGNAWWDWAWKTPQACGWSSGDDATIARRASLEDDIAAIATCEGLDFADVLGAQTRTAVKNAIGRLASLAIGRLNICREMRELDNLLGLTPKGMAALRWKIVTDVKPAEQPTPSAVASLEDRRQRIANGA